jgi:hypothetical protein
MKLRMMIMTVVFCILIIGCQKDMEKSPDNHLINSQLVKSYNDIAVQNAIESQHTLFPYHFVTNGAELNELGRRDLAALTSYFMNHAGHLNIRRQNTPANLYEARVNLVHARLLEAGVDMERMSISDDMPGGAGVTSERMLVILGQASGGVSTATSGSISSGIK